MLGAGAAKLGFGVGWREVEKVGFVQCWCLAPVAEGSRPGCRCSLIARVTTSKPPG